MELLLARTAASAPTIHPSATNRTCTIAIVIAVAFAASAAVAGRSHGCGPFGCDRSCVGRILQRECNGIDVKASLPRRRPLLRDRLRIHNCSTVAKRRRGFRQGAIQLKSLALARLTWWMNWLTHRRRSAGGCWCDSGGGGRWRGEMWGWSTQ